MWNTSVLFPCARAGSPVTLLARRRSSPTTSFVTLVAVHRPGLVSTYLAFRQVCAPRRGGVRSAACCTASVRFHVRAGRRASAHEPSRSTRRSRCCLLDEILDSPAPLAVSARDLLLGLATGLQLLTGEEIVALCFLVAMHRRGAARHLLHRSAIRPRFTVCLRRAIGRRRSGRSGAFDVRTRCTCSCYGGRAC